MPPLLPSHNDSTSCDKCPNTLLVTRADDTRDIIVKRQQIYFDEMHDIIDFFNEQGVLKQFEPKKGVTDYPQMRQIVVDFVN